MKTFDFENMDDETREPGSGPDDAEREPRPGFDRDDQRDVPRQSDRRHE